MIAFLETADCKLINAAEIERVFENNKGELQAVSKSSDDFSDGRIRLGREYQDTHAVLKALSPVIPATPGYDLLMLFDDGEEFILQIVPVVAWSIINGQFAEPVGPISVYREDYAVRCPSGVVVDWRDNITFDSKDEWLAEVKAMRHAHREALKQREAERAAEAPAK
jgi:hypothetical protein